MRDYKQGNSYTNRKPLRRGIGILGDEPKTMYSATCDNCGKKCEVPFKPSNGMPVYCNDCFRYKKDDGESRRPEKRSFRDTNFNDKQMFSATCDSCGKRCEVPFKPSNGKPVYCSDCFGLKGKDTIRNERSSDNDIKAQLEMIYKKLEKIEKLLEE